MMIKEVLKFLERQPCGHTEVLQVLIILNFSNLTHLPGDLLQNQGEA